MVEQKTYDIVFAALTLACKELKNYNIEINENTDKKMLDFKMHGSLVGYFLMKAEGQLNNK